MISVNDKPTNDWVFILYFDFDSLICDKKEKK